jgi:ubiquinone/menaquinone biosynthesis C-methylase UbiE
MRKAEALSKEGRTEVDKDQVARYWDRNATAWTAGLRSDRDIWNEVFGIPRFLRFVGPLAGLSVLDAGCGEGRSARHLARRGASVTAVDISSGMLDHAKREEACAPLGIRYEQASFADLKIFAGGSFDVVISIMALMDAPDLDDALLEFARVLRPGGRLAFMTLLPCFITPAFGKASDASGRRALLQVGRYFDEQAFVEHWSFPGGDANRPEFAVPRFPRTLARYVNGVIGAGFHLTRIEEPRPSKDEHARHPWLDFWRQTAALYLFVDAVKPIDIPRPGDAPPEAITR